MALCPELPTWAGTRKVNQCGFYWSERQWVAVASARPYASLHLAPDRWPCQHPTSQFFYRPDALLAAQPIASKHWRQYFLADNIEKCIDIVSWHSWLYRLYINTSHDPFIETGFSFIVKLVSVAQMDHVKLHFVVMIINVNKHIAV